MLQREIPQPVKLSPFQEYYILYAHSEGKYYRLGHYARAYQSHTQPCAEANASACQESQQL